MKTECPTTNDEYLDNALLMDFARHFVGYGDPASKLWFVGIEEGGGGCFLDVKARMEIWRRFETQLHLINAISYQCSLGQAPRLYRSKVFREAWASGAREYFQERLQQIYRKGDLVVNACTVGKPGPSLRALVEAAIAEVLPHALRSRREHPFRWMSDEAVRRTWK